MKIVRRRRGRERRQRLRTYSAGPVETPGGGRKSQNDSCAIAVFRIHDKLNICRIETFGFPVLARPPR
jgi:hypothetical protein